MDTPRKEVPEWAALGAEAVRMQGSTLPDFCKRGRTIRSGVFWALQKAESV